MTNPSPDKKLSSPPGGNASVGARPDACAWCHGALLAVRRDVRTRFCSRRCRQAAWRLRERLEASATPADDGGRTFAYADPPYPGKAFYYRDQPTFAGEVDHAGLIASLMAADYAGWALSTSSEALRDVLPLCPLGSRVAAWVKPIGVPTRSLGPHSTWEPVIFYGGRKLAPGVRDWLRAFPARFGGDLIGRKPIAFAAFVFDLLGMCPGDTLVDLYPGTGIMTRAWQEAGARAPAPTGRSRAVLASLVHEDDASHPSLLQRNDAAAARRSDIVTDAASCRLVGDGVGAEGAVGVAEARGR